MSYCSGLIKSHCVKCKVSEMIQKKWWDGDDACGCGGQLKFVPFDKETDIAYLMNMAAEVLEDANMHDITEMPQDIWDSVKKHIPAKKRPEAAREMVRAIIDAI